MTLKPFFAGRHTMAGTMLSSLALEVCCHFWTAEDTWYFNEADVMNLSLASRSGLFPLLPNKAHPAYALMAGPPGLRACTAFDMWAYTEEPMWRHVGGFDADFMVHFGWVVVVWPKVED